MRAPPLAQLDLLPERAPSAVRLLTRRRLPPRALPRLVLDVNRAIARVNAEAPTDRQHRRPVDPAIEAERLEQTFGR
jgi:hypothetical protein